jgi:protein-S-isoprenylcysteine O-methyltransferase Ste14
MKIEYSQETFPKKMLPPTLFMTFTILMIILGLIWPLKTIITFPYTVMGIPIIILGLGMSMWGSNKFSKVGTNIQTFEEPDILVTDGLYKYSRHPMYLGFTISLLGTFILLGSVTPIVLVLTFIIITEKWYITYEEEIMIRKFGKQYKNYQSITRKWI